MNQELVDNIRSLYNQGVPAQEIADRQGLRLTEVNAVMFPQKFNLVQVNCTGPIPKTRWNYRAGRTKREIERLAVSPSWLGSRQIATISPQELMVIVGKNKPGRKGKPDLELDLL